MQLREIMTSGVVTAVAKTSARGVTLDIAVRTGNLALAQRMTREVIEGALPQSFVHERG